MRELALTEVGGISGGGMYSVDTYLRNPYQEAGDSGGLIGSGGSFGERYGFNCAFR